VRAPRLSVMDIGAPCGERQAPSRRRGVSSPDLISTVVVAMAASRRGDHDRPECSL